MNVLQDNEINAAAMSPGQAISFPAEQGRQSPRLTVLSFGGGQDSTAILQMLLNDPAFRQRYAPNDLVIVMADTGDEHAQTYEHVARMNALCKEAYIPFVFITADMGYHSKSWQSLTHFYRTHTTIGSKAFPKTCTDRLKIQPIYRWLEAYVNATYGTSGTKKKGLRAFEATHGKIRVLIGISAEEASRRVAKSNTGPAWMTKCIDRVYPLVDLNMTRADCIDYLQTGKHEVPMPSNCMRCHFASHQDLLWLANEHPAKYLEWVEMEAAKLAKYASRETKNYGVFGKRTLPESLNLAKAKHGHLSHSELAKIKFTHGHCVRSSY